MRKKGILFLFLFAAILGGKGLTVKAMEAQSYESVEIKQNGIYCAAVLKDNGELWSLYPETTLVMEGVKEAEDGYALLENGSLQWIDGGVTELMVGVKDFAYSYYDKEVYVLAEDGTFWTAAEGSIEFTKVDENVKQITYWGYLTEDGKLTNHYGEVSHKIVEYLVETHLYCGFYVPGDGYYEYLGGEEYNEKRCDMRVRDYCGYFWNDEMGSFNLVITDTDDVWALPTDPEKETVYLGNNADKIIKVNLTEDIDWLDKDGNYYIYNQKIEPSVENPIRAMGKQINGTNYEFYITDGNYTGYLIRNGEETILTDVIGLTQLEKQLFAICTDGSVWEIEPEVKNVGTLEPPVDPGAFMKGDVNEDKKVDIQDLRMVLRGVCEKIELTEREELIADVTEDGIVNIQDLRKELRFVCGKISEL